jgi:hypothetical protein
MSTKKMTADEVMGLVLVTLYEQGAITGADLMARMGFSNSDEDKAAMKGALASLLREHKFIATEGEGKAMVFGLTQSGLDYAEQNLIEAAGGEEEGQPASEPEVVFDEFVQDTPPTRPAASKGAAKGAGPKTAGKGAATPPARPAASKPATTPAKPAASGIVGRGAAKTAGKGAATPPAEDEGQDEKVARPVKYGRIDHLSAKELESRIGVGTDMAWKFAERGSEVDTLIAELIMRSVSKCEHQLKKKQG